MLKNLTATQNLVLASLVSADTKKKLKDGVAGTNAVDMVLRFKGTLSIGADSERAPTVAIPYLEVMALFIARAGITRETSEKLIVECLTDAMAATGKGKDSLADASAQVSATLERVQAEIIAKLPLAKVKGSAKWKGTVEEVKFEVVQPEAVADVSAAVDAMLAANIGQD